MRVVFLILKKKKKGKKGGNGLVKKGRLFKKIEFSQNQKDLKFFIDENKKFLIYEDMMKFFEELGFVQMYDSFWNYFYRFGIFSFLNFFCFNEFKS